MSVDEVKANGWTAVPVSASEIVKGRGQLSPPAAITVHDVYFPSDDLLVAEAQQFAKKRFSVETYNHSMRVFYWGNAIGKQLLPELTESLSPVTWALACLLHDIGAAETYFTSTRMSFDIYGGIKAMEVLKILGSTHDQAEAVAEAIIRHQDLGVDGTITFIGQLIQLATIYDNVGEYEGIEDFGSLVHEATRDEVNKAFPRLHWSNCFAETVRREESSKPWCHTTHIPQFEEKIKANALHKKWE